MDPFGQNRNDDDEDDDDDEKSFLKALLAERALKKANGNYFSRQSIATKFLQLFDFGMM